MKHLFYYTENNKIQNIHVDRLQSTILTILFQNFEI